MISLIDADSILYQSLPKKSNPDATYEQCIAEVDNRIKNIVKYTKCSQYILFLTIGKCFRYKNWKASKPYKHSRSKGSLPPMFYAMREYMIQEHNAYFCKDLEADDLVVYFSNQFENNIICSPDKDVLFQTPGIHYDYKKNTQVSVTEEDAERFLFYQIGAGDSTDGIAGIEGVGIKTVEKWFNNKGDTTYQSLLIDKYIDKYDYHEGINRFFETFSMVYMLKNDDDMMREIGYLPKTPEIQYLTRTEEIDDLI